MTGVEQTWAAYAAEVEAWRQEMDQQMRAPGPGGWLAIVGMYPLQQGINTIGSAPESDVLLPAGAAPERLGVVDFQGETGTLHVTTDDVVTVDDVAARDAVLRNHYAPGGMSVVQVGDVRFGIMQWASDPYNIRVWDANSPKRLNFGGRAWFPVDARYRIEGQFTPYPEAQMMTVSHTGGLTQELKNVGSVAFEFGGQAFRFEAAAPEKVGDVVWLLMRDRTNGKTTYGAGRFLMAGLAADGKVDLDFNRLYHPPCAFCDYTTCPMPPKSNVIPFLVEAGERLPSAE